MTTATTTAAHLATAERLADYAHEESMQMLGRMDAEAEAAHALRIATQEVVRLLRAKNGTDTRAALLSIRVPLLK
jgi:hypothetical protein